MSRPYCAACTARQAQQKRASVAGVVSRRAEAAAVAAALAAILRPMLLRDADLSARAAARRLVTCNAIAPHLLDRARRVAGSLRRQLAASAGRRQQAKDTTREVGG